MDMDKTAIGVIETGESTQMITAPVSEATQMAMNVDCPVCRTPNPPSETYCIDCGFLLASEPTGVSVELEPVADYGKLIAADGSREFALHLGDNTVGRENADVLLSHNTISRSHAAVIVDADRVWVEDRGSTNGTLIDGQKIAADEKAELKDGSEVMFGSFVLKYQAPATQQPPAEFDDAQETDQEEVEISDSVEVEEEIDDAQPAVAELVSQDGVFRFDIHDGVNAIGRREADNDITIPDPYCSGRHADLVHSDGTFTLTDVGSSNGTAVNGARVEPNVPHIVRDADEITIGQTLFRLEVA